jgi:hypothetical protein
MQQQQLSCSISKQQQHPCPPSESSNGSHQFQGARAEVSPTATTTEIVPKCCFIVT